MRVTEKELAGFQKNSGRLAKDEGKAPKKRKYANVRTQVDGIWFDSKLEARRYVELKLLQRTGQVEYFLMQVPFHLPGGVVYKVDFFIKWRTTMLRPPHITLEDTTGKDMQAKTNKIKQVKALYGLDVEIVKAAAGTGNPARG